MKHSPSVYTGCYAEWTPIERQVSTCIKQRNITPDIDIKPKTSCTIYI